MYSQNIEVITLKMAKIENRYPQTYQQNFKWKKLNMMREYLTIKYVEKELNYYKSKLNQKSGYDSSDIEKKVRQLEHYLEIKENNKKQKLEELC